jgi:hypothetical protein
MLAKSDSVADSAAEVELRAEPLSVWRLVDVAPLSDYRLSVTFRDGQQGVVDMKALIFSPSAGVFAVLRDEALFAKVRVETGAPVWPGEVDLAPDAIYDGVRASGGHAYKPGDPCDS